MTHPLFDNRLAESQGFTGFGAGAFSVFFPILHKSAWGQAHNEFMEFMFNNGILGLGMLLAAIVVFFKQAYKYFWGGVPPPPKYFQGLFSPRGFGNQNSCRGSIRQ